MTLQGFNFEINHVKTHENISDYFSRHPFSDSVNVKYLEEYVNFNSTNAFPKSLTLSDMKRETLKDQTLQMLKDFITTTRVFLLIIT